MYFIEGGIGQRQVSELFLKYRSKVQSVVVSRIPRLAQPIKHETYTSEPLSSYASG